MLERRHFLAMLGSTGALLAAKPSQASLFDLLAEFRVVYRFASVRIPVHKYSIASASMAPTLLKGDVVLADLRSINIPPPSGELMVVKWAIKDTVSPRRVIGLPRDRIQVERSTQYIETLPGGVQHRILERSDDGALDDTGVYAVPPDHWFGMGDNRDNSLDSRVIGAGGAPAPIGYIPAERLVGRIVYRLRPKPGWLVSPETIPGLAPE